MAIDIKPVHCGTYDCTEDAMVTLLNWAERDYKILFAESWGFQFDLKEADNGRIGEKIGPMKGDVRALLEKYFGIKTEFYSNLPKGKIMSIICKELEKGMPVAFFLDLFWCPWSEYYQKVHSGHLCIASAVNYNDGSLFCVDPTMMKTDMILPVSDFNKGCQGCVTLSSDECKEKDAVWRDIIGNAVDRLFSSRCFEQVRRFAELLGSSLDIKKEVEGYSVITDSPIFKNLLYISQGRINFATVLKSLAEKNNNSKLLEVAGQLENCGWEWQTARVTLLKDYCTENSQKRVGEVAEKINALAGVEEDIANSLLHLAGESENELDSGAISENTPNMKEHKEETIFVKLDEYFNSKAFGSNKAGDNPGNFDGNNYFYFLQDLPKESIWCKNDRSFQFPVPSCAAYDNVACDGQVIELPSNCYSRIIMLGSAERGSFREHMYICYEDNEEKKIDLQFSDWWEPQPFFGETVMWKGRCCKFSDNRLEVLNNEVSIFSQSCLIDKSKAVKSIRLPQWPNIHIFAISLIS